MAPLLDSAMEYVARCGLWLICRGGVEQRVWGDSAEEGWLALLIFITSSYFSIAGARRGKLWGVQEAAGKLLQRKVAV